MKSCWTKIVGSLDVMLITKSNIFDGDHRNSLFARQVSAITFFAEGWAILSSNSAGVLYSNQCVMPEAQIKKWRIHDARDHTVGILDRGRTVRCDIHQFKRVGGLELEIRLVPDDGRVARVRLYFDGAMPRVKAR
jgi:hypothetical protein